ncbi:MAG: MBL fold metallo-hydrolase [Acidobacteria bacterium]|nr:MBL fold metallo-hydrolase [Acidobacteriota bacterium]
MGTHGVAQVSPTELLPGLFRIEVPLPQSPLRSINSYVIPTGDGGLVVDTGMLRPECETVLRAGFAELGVDPGRARFFITHIHADHSGLVTALAGPGATVMMGRIEIELLEHFVSRERFLEVLAERGRMFGLAGEEVQGAASRHPGLRYSPTSYPTMTPVDDGDHVEAGGYRFRVIHTPGHTPGHLCLWEASRRLLISGDHILGDITPNITSWMGVRDSLGDYLRSLERTAGLGAARALPGHRGAIGDVNGRIAELQAHHARRLEEVLRILKDGPQTVCQVAARMSWEIVAEDFAAFPVAQKWFACGEASAHLDRLEVLGRAGSFGDPPRWELS